MKTKVLKKLCSFLLVLSMLTSTGIGQAVGEFVGTNLTVSAADIFTYGNYEYTLNNACVTITQYKGGESYITVPDKINGFPVTAIAEWAFQGCSTMKKIQLPTSITVVGGWAFWNCFNLTDVIMSDRIISIPDCTFYDCTNLQNINIPAYCRSIGFSAFYGCASLKNITIPDYVENIDDAVFLGCTGLMSINVSENNKSYVSENGILLNRAQTDIICYPAAKSGSYIMPSSVESIKYFAFEFCNKLTDITLSENIVEIDNVFRECANLENIYVPEKNPAYSSKNGVLFDKGQKTLIRCPSGKSNYTIPDHITSVAGYAFHSCRKISQMTVPNGVVSVGESAFNECSSLRNCVLPNSVRELGIHAFSNCKSLENVTLSDNITSIGTHTFYCCESLLSLTIPNSAKEIGTRAFEYCRSLKDIYIPANVTYIEDYAFAYCNEAVIYGQKGSYAEIYANKLNIPFAVMDPIPKPKDISELSITLSMTSYVYDGKPKKPTVTVKNGDKTLVLNTDYSISYSDNINAGTANVTISGLGNHNGSVTKPFTINPKSIANATITVNPTVTVKDGDKTLVLNTDYSVSYPNNINIGTAELAVTGIGNYCDTVTIPFSITEPSLTFQWNVDNWLFENSSKYIANVPYSEKINSTYQNVLKENLSYSEYKKIFWGEGREPAWLNTTGGSCYGMSAVALLAKYGFMDFAGYQKNASRLYDLDAPIKHSLNYLSNKNNVSSLITYYQMLQTKDVIQQKCRKISNRSNKENIQEILSLLDKNAVVLVGYRWGTEKSLSAHAVLAYGYGYKNNTFNGVTYDGYIRIYDPNCSYNNTDVYIYFKKSTYDWIIPGKNFSSFGYPPARFQYVGADFNEINNGGYLNKSIITNTSDNFIARIDAPVISDERFVGKVAQSGGIYMSQSSGENDIVEDYSYILNGNSNGIFGYNLYDSDSAYEVSQRTADKLELHMDYETCDLYGYSSLGKSVVFDKKGFVSIKGKTGDYEIAMTFDRDYPTDWFYINVSGTEASDISLLKEKNGYILSGDNLKNIRIFAKNMTDSASIGFSTDYKTVFIYETDKNTIGLKIDKDNNGTYETRIKGVPILENNSYLSSDSIQLGSTVTVIASGKGGEGDLQYAVYYKKQSESKWTVAQNYNASTTVPIPPAKATNYDICVKVKDSSGTVEKKYFVVSVYDILKNTSTVSPVQINLGSEVSVKCSATGGTGSYTYAVYYKQKSQSKWTVRQDFGKNATASVKPAKATDYDICIKVKDSSGTVEKKYFVVSVSDLLKNTSTISSAQIKLGSTISVKASATGGTGNYTYAVYYKQKSQSKWTVKQDFSKNATVSIKSKNVTDYDICVKVRDGSGTVEKKYFNLSVHAF